MDNLETFIPIKPRQHQLQTIDFIVNNSSNKGCLINVDPGLGKTLSSLWALDLMIKSGKVKKCLIIAPLSTLGDNVWTKEMRQLPHIKYNIILGTNTKRLKALQSPSTIDFINIDGVTSLLKNKLLPCHYDMIIYDECTSLKNPSTSRWKLFFKYLKTLPECYSVIMTGTPVSNSPLEAWTLIKLVNPDFNIKYTRWKDLTCYKHDMWNYKPRKNAAQVIAHYLKPTLVIKSEGCLDLPPLQVIPYKIEMSKQQARFVEELKRKSLVKFAELDTTVSAFNPAVVTNKMMQALGGVIYDDVGGTVQLDFTERYNALFDIVSNNNAPTVVFCGYKAIQAELLRKFEHDGIKAAIVNGDVSSQERQVIFAKFNNNELDAIICHELTTSHGIDLTASNTIVYYLPIYSNELYRQSLARIRRISSEGRGHKTFRVFQFASTKWEEERYRILDTREELQENVRDIMLSLQNTNFETEEIL